MVELYYLSGSRHSYEAEKLLQNNKLPYRKIDVVKMNIVGSVNSELGIQKLPTVLDNGSQYQGIAEIKSFVENQGKNKQ